MQSVVIAASVVWGMGNVPTMLHPVQLEEKKALDKKSAWVVRYAARERSI
ncbi:hypothetical protein [Paenibacillus pabuli]|nr:hypothetical protein [Paenibacillus pabuli]MEC0123702.1 hypothetical protein [Paenibacillus pabuli]